MGHCADEASARAAVRDYIEEWEFQADLTIGAGKITLGIHPGRDRGPRPCVRGSACAIMGNIGIDTSFHHTRSGRLPKSRPWELPLTLMTSCSLPCDSGTMCIRGVRKP